MANKKNEKKRQEALAHDRCDMRRRLAGEYFMEQTFVIRPWLYDITRRYKERGRYPLTAVSLLPSYYTEKRDKEVAAVMGILIAEDDRVLEHISTFRDMLGASPWTWFKQRRFISLSLGDNQLKHTGGILNWKIATVMDRLYGDAAPESLFDAVHRMAARGLRSYVDVLTEIYDICFKESDSWRIRLLLLVLATSDGLGQSVWRVDTPELRCPVRKEIKNFLKTFFPDYMRFGTADEAIALFGLDNDYDFYYTWLGYKEIQKSQPEACSKMTTLYQRRYSKVIYSDRYHWEILLPVIDFG